jgi:hypothetical protein
MANPRSAGRHLRLAPAGFIAEPGAQAPLQQHQRRPGFDSKPLAFCFCDPKICFLQGKFSRAIAANTAKKALARTIALDSKVSFCNRFETKRNPPLPSAMVALPLPISLFVLSSHLPKEFSESVPAGVPLFLIEFSDRS